jgi:hypothetical protein
MPRNILEIICLSVSVNCWSADVICKIQIEDVVAGTTYTVEHSFVSDKDFGDRKQFDLPGSEYKCNLWLLNLNSGTTLSCELDELGHNFVQSDRSKIEEKDAKNHLSFRYKSSFFVLKTSCK